MCDLHLKRSCGEYLGSLWCCLAPDLSSGEDPYFEEFFHSHGFYFDIFEQHLETFPRGRKLGEAIRARCRPSWYDICYAAEVDLDSTIYEFAEFGFYYPEGSIKLPNITFVGITFRHLGKAYRKAQSAARLSEVMAKCRVIA